MVQIESAEDPFRDPSVARPAYAAIQRAEAMGLLEGGKEIASLSLPALRRVVRAVRKAGIAGATQISFGYETQGVVPGQREALVRGLATLNDALEQSPAPAFEWRRLRVLFEAEELADLLRISVSSLRRYESGVRATPDDVAARLHFLALVTGDLAGAYNGIGTRRWFRRKRTLLDGRAPADLLRGEWRPEDPGPARVRDLARALTTSPAT